jgi:hypothetical protein
MQIAARRNADQKLAVDRGIYLKGKSLAILPLDALFCNARQVARHCRHRTIPFCPGAITQHGRGQFFYYGIEDDAIATDADQRRVRVQFREDVIVRVV